VTLEGAGLDDGPVMNEAIGCGQATGCELGREVDRPRHGRFGVDRVPYLGIDAAGNGGGDPWHVVGGIRDETGLAA